RRVSRAWRRKAAQKRPHPPSPPRQSARPAQLASAFSVPQIAIPHRILTPGGVEKPCLAYLAANRPPRRRSVDIIKEKPGPCGPLLFGLDFALEVDRHALEISDHAFDLGYPSALFVDLKLLQADQRFT